LYIITKRGIGEEEGHSPLPGLTTHKKRWERSLKSEDIYLNFANVSTDYINGIGIMVYKVKVLYFN